MTADRWKQVETFFLQVVECPEAERPALLGQLCADDPELRQEVESLLAHDAPDEKLVEINGDGLGDSEVSLELTGRRIGPYRIVQLIGHGGMGSVYLGVRDDDQFRKQVAIKLVNRGMDTVFMLNRFRQERQILANLEHPFIARLMDGGATEDGLPYFVMEYVDGLPITSYCSANNLSIPERLQLFRLVCEAIQYAHQNLVVHRDIKPGNILTTKEGVPKLVDFGIAKILKPQLQTNTTITQRELLMMTPDYASPEQVTGSPISTASDIYSLGAVLYELLSGQKPHRFASGSITDIERAICEVEPERPSRAATGPDRKLKRQLSGDLDKIVLTALRKEPQRRYASGAQLSEDIRRHLEGLPVMAQEDRWAYRARKFIARHKVGVAAALVLLTSLIAGIAATTYQARRAEHRFQLVRGLSNSILFGLHDEMARLPGSTALRALTIQTVVKYLDQLAQDGSMDAGLNLEIAAAYDRIGSLEGHPFTSNLGHTKAALDHYRKALAIYESLTDNEKVKVEALRGVIDMHIKVGEMEGLTGNASAAAPHLQKAAALVAEEVSQGSLQRFVSRHIDTYYRLASVEYQRARADSELAYIRKALELSRKWSDSDTGVDAAMNLRTAYTEVGNAQARNGDLAGAHESFLTAQSIAEKILVRADAKYDERYNVVGLYNAHGDLFGATDDPNLGNNSGALALYGQALAFAEKFAADDPKNSNARRHVASSYRRHGMIWMEKNPALALEYYRRSLTIAEELNAGDINMEYQYATSRAYMGIGEALYHLRKNSDAVQNLNRAVTLQKAMAVSNPERVWNLRVLTRTYSLLGDALLANGETDQALTALQDGLAFADTQLQRAPTSLYHALDRADVLEATGRYYFALSSRRGLTVAQRAECMAQAKVYFEKSLTLWQDWMKRNVATTYAARRQGKMLAAIGTLNRVSTSGHAMH